jgi:putative ABC transport system ATP-binding protein/lipoprotein-releasing system ATP-binding protein
MITVKNLIKNFEGTPDPVIKNIDLEIKDGEFISLVGRSGSGKSTLLYLISTLDRDFKGDILYDNRSVFKMGSEEIHKLRNTEIGFVFQFHYLLNELSALENVLLPARKANLLKEKEAFAYELLKEVGLAGKENRQPANLSGGEQQRVAIARALIMKPHYVFADEPTGNLDSANGEIIMNLFEKFNHDFNTTITFVTHDQDFANRAKRQIHITDGSINI